MMIWFAAAILIWEEALDDCNAALMLAHEHASSASYVSANRNAVAALQLAASNHLSSKKRRYALMNRIAIDNNREQRQ